MLQRAYSSPPVLINEHLEAFTPPKRGSFGMGIFGDGVNALDSTLEINWPDWMFGANLI